MLHVHSLKCCDCRKSVLRHQEAHTVAWSESDRASLYLNLQIIRCPSNVSLINVPYNLSYSVSRHLLRGGNATKVSPLRA